MNIYALLPLAAFLANISLGIFVLYKGPKEKLNRLYAILAFAWGLWAFGDFLVFSAQTPEAALFYSRLTTAGASLTGLTALTFLSTFAKSRFFTRRLVIAILSFISAFFIYVGFETGLVSSSMHKIWWGYNATREAMYMPLAIYVMGTVITGVLLCYMSYRKSSSAKEKIQAKFITIAITIPLMCGVATQVLPVVMGLDIIPLSSTTTSITAVIIAYAMIKYKLMTPASFSIYRKIVTFVLISGIIPLVVIGAVSMTNTASLDLHSRSSVTELGTFAINGTTDALETMGAEMIKQKALDVARQVGIFTSANPDLNISELEANEEMKAIAVQPVGKTGYTAVHDKDAVNHFHVNPKLVGFDLHNLADKFPGFWKILEESLSQESQGYYDWEDADGVVRKKYMHCSPVEETGLSVCATTYIDEFSAPSIEIGEHVTRYMKVTTDKIKWSGEQLQNTVIIILLCSAALIAIIALLLARMITRPIKELISASTSIGEGKFDTKIGIKSHDEMGNLASAFNQMANTLSESHKKIREHSRELEGEVDKRTKDLDKKLGELTETKTAMLNMMEDMDDSNKLLVSAQRELKKSMKTLREIDVKKDQFISIAAHELKTPLTSIHGFSQLLMNRKVANNSAKRNKYLRIMDHETKRLSTLVTDILDLSRIDLGTVKLTLENVDMNSLIGDMKNEMDILTKEKKLKLDCKISKHLPTIKTDREKVTQILINLINNAVKYTNKGKIAVNAIREGHNIHVTVEDTGIGISKENQEKIFERFYQVDSSYTRKAGGTGLGLSLCKEFVELMEGRIWVESALGKGSKFHFNLPIKGPASKQHERAPEKADSAKKWKLYMKKK